MIDVWRFRKEINELINSGKWDEARVKLKEYLTKQKEKSAQKLKEVHRKRTTYTPGDKLTFAKLRSAIPLLLAAGLFSFVSAQEESQIPAWIDRNWILGKRTYFR